MSPPPREGYGRRVRRFELASIGAYAGLMGWLFLRLCGPAATHPAWALVACGVGFVVADFSSGLVHWAADTWGTPEWPLVGAALIRPFREHHLDPQDITRHDFVETNGNNCFISIPPVVVAALLPPSLFLLQTVIFAGSLAIFGTNQFHKWSHMDAPPRPVAWLQRAHLVLPPDHHAVHHTAPFATHYCITAGWLNATLHRLGFFPRLERIVSAITGLAPRANDPRAER